MAAKQTIPVHPDEKVEKIVIVANPSFSAALKFMLLGAALGAGAMWGALNRRADSGVVPPSGSDQARATREAELETRTARLARRVQTLARQTKTVAGIAAETLGPAIGAAVVEGRKAARDMEGTLREDLRCNDEDEIEKV